jgi:host factor-I protein
VVVLNKYSEGINGMSKKLNIQDLFLNHVRRKRIPVTVYLMNGVKLEGLVKGFDNFVIVLKDENQKMIYKHAISTIEPSEEIPEIEVE